MTGEYLYPGCRSTRDGGRWEWFPGSDDYSAPQDDIAAFVNAASTHIDRIDRVALVLGKIKDAEKGLLEIYIEDGRYHDVRQVDRAPELLELRWTHDEFATDAVGDWRLYFVEPPDQPEALVAVRFAIKIDTDQQNDEIDIAERIRVDFRYF